MAYRGPRYAFLHAAKAAGVSAVTLAAGTEASGYPIRHLLDERAGALFKWSASGTDRAIVLDRGAAGLEAIDRLLIPSGHNLAGFTGIKVESDDNSGFSSPTTVLTQVAVSAGLVDKALTSTTERYLRLTIVGTGTPELGELVYTRTRTLTRGPDPEWTDEREPNILTVTLDSGVTAQLERGSARRVFALTYHAVESTDTATLEALLAAAGYGRSPFWLDPPDDGDAAVWVELVRARRRQDHSIPSLGVTYRYDLELREVLG